MQKTPTKSYSKKGIVITVLLALLCTQAMPVLQATTAMAQQGNNPSTNPAPTPTPNPPTSSGDSSQTQNPTNGPQASSNQAQTSAAPVVPDTLNVGQYLTAPGQTQAPNIASLFIRVINFLALGIGTFSFFAFVVGGFFWLISGGRESDVQKGKDIITYAIIGLIVGLSAYTITSFIQGIFFEYG